MVKEINLLKESNTESKTITQARFYIKIVTPAALLIFIIVVIAVYGYALAQKAKAEDVANRLLNTRNAIESKSDVESYQAGAKIKLETVKKILNDQIDYAKIIGNLNEIQPGEIELTTLSMTNDRSINVSYKAANSDMLSQLINLLIDPNVGSKYFENQKIKSLFYGKDGFTVNLNFTIRK